jgi:hypothetical protein
MQGVGGGTHKNSSDCSTPQLHLNVVVGAGGVKVATTASAPSTSAMAKHLRSELNDFCISTSGSSSSEQKPNTTGCGVQQCGWGERLWERFVGVWALWHDET